MQLTRFQLTPRSWHWLGFAVVFLAGVLIRLDQIGSQVLADDEWHALHSVLHSTYPRVLTHFGVADRCIPLTLLYKLTSDTAGLSELLVRAPVLLAGIAALAVFPFLISRLFHVRVALVFAGLLAISPLHIYFSRYARPYSVSLLLAFAAVLAFCLWYFKEESWGRWVYVAGAILAPWFHLMFLPVCLAPLGFGWLVETIKKHRGTARTTSQCASRNLNINPATSKSFITSLSGGAGYYPRELVRLGVIISIGLVVLIGPPLIVDFQALTSKAKGIRPDFEGFRVAFSLMAGLPGGWPLLTTLLLVCLGTILSLWRWRGPAVFLIALSVIQLSTHIVAQPDSGQAPIVLTRYCLFILPVLLLLLASSLEYLDGLVARLARTPGVIVAPAFAVLLYWGPLKDIYYRPNGWTNHAVFQYCYDPASQWHYYSDMLQPQMIPAFYSRLAGKRHADILEVPWYYEWHNNAYLFYQKVHQQRMYAGWISAPSSTLRWGELPLGDKRFRMKNFVHVLDHDGIRRRNIRFAVFHKDLNHELASPAPRLPADVSHWVVLYRQIYGAPVYDDQWITVFDVSAIRPNPTTGAGDQSRRPEPDSHDLGGPDGRTGHP